MRNLLVTCGLLLLTASSLAQGKRLWVLRSPGEMVEYDPATFAVKQTVKVPAEAMKSPESIWVNRAGRFCLRYRCRCRLRKKMLRRRTRFGFGMGTARPRSIKV